MRKIIFWTHLCCGVSAGLVVLMMSITGVILTYERQILAWEDNNHYSYSPADAETRLSIDELLASSQASSEDFSPTSITVGVEPSAPVILRAGRSGSQYLNPYNGEIYPPKSDTLDNFFSAVTGWHRWFNISGDNRATARAITGASNLMFLFLACSGLYLWLPSMYRWSTMRLRLWFHPNAKSGAARDFNWHHVFGFWLAIPLIVIIATATVFNYGWANNLVYKLAGEEPPVRGAPPAQPGPDTAAAETSNSVDEYLSYDALFQRAASQQQQWRTLTLTLPADASESEVSFSIDMGNGGQPQKRDNLVLDRQTGEVNAWLPFSTLSTGRQARSWVRFLHTGEALGIAGQTLAGLASAAGVLLVWTGLALALRRFQGYLLRQRKARSRMSAQTSS